MSKIALITGSSSGIGLSTAIVFAKAGFTVVATMRDLSKSQALREQAALAGVSFDIRRLDVCDEASVDACVRETIAQHGRIDVLINNAGAGMVGTVEQLSTAEVQRSFDVNFFGVWRVTRSVLPHMRTAGAGRIITVSSLNGVVGLPFNEAYCAAKFAVEGFMESLASLARLFGVHVSLIEPGAVNTEFLSASAAQHPAPKSDAADPYGPLLTAYLENRKGRFAAGQTGEEVGKVILEAATADAPHLRYQTSDFARSVTSQIRVDPTGDSILKQLGAQLKR